VSFVINDWIELRADALKITLEMQRPIPWRADTIGPWLDSLSFLTWLGSLTTSALVYLFSNDGLGPDGTPYDIKGWALLLAIIFSEHVFFAVRWAVRLAVSKIESPGLQKERRERYVVRRKYFDESLGSLEKKPSLKDLPAEEPTRESLEDEARKGSQHSASVEDRFWRRQRGWRESVEVGATYIERAAVGNETKKEL
jgi:anoctamin-10